MATLMAVLGSMLLGAATWGVLEYLLHRFVGHSPRSMTQFAREHRQHHSMGNYFAPAAKKALVAVPVMGTVAALGWWWLGPVAASYTLGLASMYLAYEWFHRRLHTHPPRGAFGRWARRHHFHHHYGDPRSNHGVTSPVMDWVFGTTQQAGVTRVPVKLVPQWLVDPATGAVWPQFAADYTLAGRGAVAPLDGPPPAMDANAEGVA